MVWYGICRHGTMNAFKDTVTRTVQMFKLTHQDRWNEFKLSFSREQLEDLQVGSTTLLDASCLCMYVLTRFVWQGAGAAHYFS